MDQESELRQEDSALLFHPYNIIMVLTIGSLTMLFLALTASFVYSRVQNGEKMPEINFPPIFLVNTLILLGSSATLQWAKKCYLWDETENYQKALLYTIILSVLFMVSQFFGWSALFASDIFIDSNLSASYLYAISGLHFVHVIAGLPFLVLFLLTAIKRMKEPVSVLVYFSDPAKRLKLRLLTLYWHFLDALWIYLVLFFLINRYLI
ncbi:MAG: cytochrome c oxidase subunit 3 [Saprospiraceae bacterium]|jgi:cytochrome c oxidase subunit 3